MIGKNELIEGFQQAGVNPGDTLLVHSSYKSLGGVDGGPQAVIDALLDGAHARGDADHADLQF